MKRFTVGSWMFHAYCTGLWGFATLSVWQRWPSPITAAGGSGFVSRPGGYGTGSSTSWTGRSRGGSWGGGK